MIDIHTHLLPGVDDGSPTLEHSASVLARLRGEGVRGLVCTPHLNASQAPEGPFEEYAVLLKELRALKRVQERSLALTSSQEHPTDDQTIEHDDAID